MKTVLLLSLFICLSAWAQNESNGFANPLDEKKESLGQGGTFGSVGVNVNDKLTDGQQNTVNTFFHDGLANQILKEECQKKENRKACRDESAYVYNRKTDMTIEAVSKMFSLFSLASGQTGNTGTGSGQGSTGNKFDYCGVIPAGTEAISQSYQQAAQDKISQDLALPDGIGQGDESKGEENKLFVNKQKESVYALMRSHKARQDSAEIQYAGWGVTTGCYGVQLVDRGLSGGLDPMIIVKGAAAGALATFYKKKHDKQKRYQKILKKLVKKLPDVGDCNPVTERQCYCTHPSTANDPEHCLPQILASRARDDRTVVTCVNNALQDDPECKCLDTDTCYDKTFKDLTVKGKFGTNQNAGLLRESARAFRGNLSPGGELAGLTDAQLARSKIDVARAIAKAKDLKLTNRALSDEEQLQADALEGLGLPKKLANHFAAQPTTAASRNFAKSLRKSGYKGYSKGRRRRRKKKSGANVLYFKSRGLKGKPAVSSNSRNRFNKFRRGKGKKGGSGNSILKFANKATGRAQISRDTSKPIFEIISRRYQVSAWDRLELVGKK